MKKQIKFAKIAIQHGKTTNCNIINLLAFRVMEKQKRIA